MDPMPVPSVVYHSYNPDFLKLNARVVTSFFSQMQSTAYMGQPMCRHVAVRLLNELTLGRGGVWATEHGIALVMHVHKALANLYTTRARSGVHFVTPLTQDRFAYRVLRDAFSWYWGYRVLRPLMAENFVECDDAIMPRGVWQAMLLELAKGMSDPKCALSSMQVDTVALVLSLMAVHGTNFNPAHQHRQMRRYELCRNHI